MTLLHESVDFKKMDVRMIERNVARGLISADEVEKAVKKLPDDAENAQWTSLDTLMAEGESGSLLGSGSSEPNGQMTSH